MNVSAPTRERLVTEAMRLFSAKGFEATSVSQIEAAAGLAAPGGARRRNCTTATTAAATSKTAISMGSLRFQRTGSVYHSTLPGWGFAERRMFRSAGSPERGPKYQRQRTLQTRARTAEDGYQIGCT